MLLSLDTLGIESTRPSAPTSKIGFLPDAENEDVLNLGIDHFQKGGLDTPGGVR